jgi:hypothetical protein
MTDWMYLDSPRIQYESGAVFVRVCTLCGRFVKADETILVGDAGLKPGPNATCSHCGRVEMAFEGFM